MSLPTFADRATPTSKLESLSRTVAASRLEIHVAHVDKMVRAGMLPLPIMAAAIAQLVGRPKLEVTAGELTVLRTDARQDADRSRYPDDPRAWMGFHVRHTDDELEQTSLRWWRCEPRRVLNNELFAVTVATFPVAVYRITEHRDTYVRPDEDMPRQHFAGQLLARVSPDMAVTFCDPMAGYLRDRVQQIMASRVTVSSGGPIGYLDPATS